ncbi:redoxin domain-containing protein [Roseisolibacter sp. H3M3-2]|uniref:redoxin domain-containing protein n=1 Tax=Roseisolibacter sp. H3M3-2 TaxID=3031323 RepID=UPI0023DA9E41|nr:redoxin domain-containing protein [Roseisolibacter sp. H3M3-2]MDF1503460.1 redoxin domain-containing protein [Roseisolibacter sp. H3M3-2]
MSSPKRPLGKRLLVGLGAAAGVVAAGLVVANLTVGLAPGDLAAMALNAAGGGGAPSAPPPDPSAAPKVGVAAPAFTAVDTRGATHSLDDYRGRWVVLEWFNHECPYSKKHYKPIDGGAGNTQAMQRDYANRVVWLSVVSSGPGRQGFTTAAEADALTREKGAAPAAVIRDTAGTLGRLYGARNTPQYAIIDPEGVLRYSGAIDDRPTAKFKDIAEATNYVRSALDAGLTGAPIAVAQTQPYGCDVKY